MSVLSFPNRGKWGNPKWRGNCSGWVYHYLFTKVCRPQLFVDPMMGSGTSIEVATELGIRAIGLDLHSGFNILRDSIRESVGEPADMVVSHPPYHDIIRYSGEQWGEPHPDDLSRCSSVEEFNEKIHIALLNQRNATKAGGYYGMIIGDMRKQGAYYSFQAEAIARMPDTELVSVIIKQQHNVKSDAKEYAGVAMPRIMHEYLLLWKKPARTAVSMLGTLATMATVAQKRLQSTWKAVVRSALVELGGKAALATIYEQVAAEAPERIAGNANWKSKVRQVLEENPEHFSCKEDVWCLTSSALAPAAPKGRANGR